MWAIKIKLQPRDSVSSVFRGLELEIFVLAII